MGIDDYGYAKNGVVTLSCLWKQNEGTDKGRYRTEKFSSLLSKMQAGKLNSSKEFAYNSSLRARRTDAEPMNL